MHFGHKGKRNRWTDYHVFKRQPKNGGKHGEFVAAQRGRHLLLGSPCLQSHDRRSLRERSRVSGGNSSNVEEELSRNFRIPRVGVQQPPLYNPRVNYGSNGNSGKKGKLRSSSWKGKSAKESLHNISHVETGLRSRNENICAIVWPVVTMDHEIARCVFIMNLILMYIHES